MYKIILQLSKSKMNWNTTVIQGYIYLP